MKPGGWLILGMGIALLATAVAYAGGRAILHLAGA